MDDTNKREFLNILIEIGKIYDQSKSDIVEKSPIYWSSLNHRSIEDIKSALNSHVRDSDRGRFFPKPADIEAKLPGIASLWLSADEAWAMCPKDENDSAAMTNEMAQALYVANDLIIEGDMIAARMAFKSSYNRLVDEAKMNGRKPEWFASLGIDKEGRHKAQVKVVEMQNLSLPYEQRKALPQTEQGQTVRLEDLTKEIEKRSISPEDTKKRIEELRKMLSKTKEI